MIDSTEAETKVNTLSQTGPWIGIDGCRGGWIIAWLQSGQPAKIYTAETLLPFLKKVPKQATILIDMILYKTGDPSPRQFDRLAKSQLGKWHSRVFPAPPEEALKSEDYRDACLRSHSIGGKKISKQCYNLFPKIREVNHPEIPEGQLIEYHPELAFRQLNQNKIVEPSKKTELGRIRREQLIKRNLSDYPDPLIKPKSKKFTWQADDLLDALALALVAKNGAYQDFYQSLAKADSSKD